MNYRKILSLILVIVMVFSFAACGKKEEPVVEESEYDAAVLDVFCTDSALVVLSQAGYSLKSEYPQIDVRFTHGDGETLAAEVAAGFACDIYVADAEYLVDWLDAESSEEENPNGNDCVVSRSDFAKNDDVVLTAAVLKSSEHEKEAQLFVDFLTSSDMETSYKDFGFEMLKN